MYFMRFSLVGYLRTSLSVHEGQEIKATHVPARLDTRRPRHPDTVLVEI